LHHSSRHLIESETNQYASVGAELAKKEVHNAVAMWRGLKSKMGEHAEKPCIASAIVTPVQSRRTLDRASTGLELLVRAALPSG
jgi:hypothetical protein